MKRISRRNFLKAAGVGAAALGLAACGSSSSYRFQHDFFGCCLCHACGGCDHQSRCH